MMTEVLVRESRCTWIGEVTWRHTATLREQIFDLLETDPPVPLFLDVSAVSCIDRTGVALLIGSNHRAAAMGRRLVLVDRTGLVTRTLAAAGVLPSFVIRSAEGAAQVAR